MKDYFRFKKMITPLIIEILFWLLSGVSVIWGIIMVVQGASSDFGGGSQVLLGLVSIVLGPVVSRVYSEILLVVFKIHEALEDIREQGRRPIRDNM